MYNTHISKKNLFEKEKVINAVTQLAIPSVISQVILVIYNVADTFFVGLSGSDIMITSVTICMPAFMILSAIANLFGIGGTSLIARSLGNNDVEKAKNTFAFSFWGCVFITISYCLCTLVFSRQIINLLGGLNPSVHKNAYYYLLITIVCGGLPTVLNNLFAHLIRSNGYSTQSSIGITIGGILNIVFDALFMFVILPKGNEALGAAIATALSNVISLLYFVIFIYYNKNTLTFSISLNKKCIYDNIPRDVFFTGIPACIMTLFENISYATLERLMYNNGLSSQAGIGVAKKINMLSHCIVRGITQGVLPLIAYNYSTNNKKRLKSIIATTISFVALVSFVCMLFCLLFNNILVSFFISKHSSSYIFGRKFLMILCAGAPFSAFAYCTISLFQATNHGYKSLILALLRKGILDIPMMFILNKIIPIYGIVWATPITDLICCIIAIILFIIFYRNTLSLQN